MSNNSLPRFPYGLPEHPLLRIAADEGKSAREFTKFNRVLRSAISRSLTPAERIPHAKEALTRLTSLKIGAESQRELRLEFLRTVAHELGAPLLLEQLAASELEDVGLYIAPKGWSESEPGSLDLPYITRTRPGSMISDEVQPAVKAWSAILDLAVKSLLRQELHHWDEQDCASAMRALVFTSVSVVSGYPRVGAARLAFMEGVGRALWLDLARVRLGSEVGDTAWSDEVLGKLMLHLRAISQTSRSPELSADDEWPPEQVTCGRQDQQLVVVTEPIPPSKEKSDRDALMQYERLRQPLPLAAMPERGELQARLAQLETEFPWASEALRTLEDLIWPPCLLGTKCLKVNPVLLVGRPGAGKSRFARRFSELFALPYLAVSCGGSGDSKVISGTSRGWSTGEPMPVLKLLLQRRSASAFVLLDELDKCASHHHSSPPLPSVLLGLLEPETASRWRDGYLQAACDLSGVIFWATANSLSSVPRPLLSRFLIVHVPEPGPKHLQSLADSITSEIEAEWQLPSGTLPRLPAPDTTHGLNARELRHGLQRQLAAFVRKTFSPERLH